MPKKPVLTSQECLNLEHALTTPGEHPWRPGPQPQGTWHEYNVLRNSVCDWFRYRGLNFLVKTHWVHLQHAPITSRFVLFFFKKNELRTPSVNPTLSVNIWFSNLNCKILLEYLLGFIMCIYHLHFLDAECPQVYWEATGTQEIAAGNILNNIFWSFPSHLENWAQSETDT